MRLTGAERRWRENRRVEKNHYQEGDRGGVSKTKVAVLQKKNLPKQESWLIALFLVQAHR